MKPIFAQRMQERRLRVDLSYQRMAALTRIPPQQLKIYEDGLEEIPAGDLAKIARALTVSADWMLGLTDDLPPAQLRKLSELEIKIIKLIRSKPKNRLPDIVEILRRV
jgi:transcriptional regulator with XRE-family HTH domain